MQTIIGLTWHRFFAVAIGSCFITLCTGVSGVAADEQDPMSVVQTYVRALDSGDALVAAAVFTDNAIHIHPISLEYFVEGTLHTN